MSTGTETCNAVSWAGGMSILPRFRPSTSSGARHVDEARDLGQPTLGAVRLVGAAARDDDLVEVM